jgi:hypothetical protein
MEEEAARPQGTKLQELKENLQSWNFFEWLIIFVDVPLVLLLLYAFPQYVRDQYLIFHTSDLLSLPSYVLSSYTHSEFFHLAGNLAMYYILIGAVFLFERDRCRFRIMAAVAFFLVPFVCTFLTIGLWHFFGTGTSMQGFSGIDAAFLAYAFMAGVTWFLSGRLETFDHPELFPGSRLRFYILYSLLTVMLVAIVYEGIIMGQFTSTGDAITNGIAHFGGFVTGLVAFLAYDLVSEKRRSFDVMLAVSILAGLAAYAVYLVWVVRAVRGFS